MRSFPGRAALRGSAGWASGRARGDALRCGRGRGPLQAGPAAPFVAASCRPTPPPRRIPHRFGASVLPLRLRPLRLVARPESAAADLRSMAHVRMHKPGRDRPDGTEAALPRGPSRSRPTARLRSRSGAEPSRAGLRSKTARGETVPEYGGKARTSSGRDGVARRRERRRESTRRASDARESARSARRPSDPGFGNSFSRADAAWGAPRPNASPRRAGLAAAAGLWHDAGPP